MLVVWGLLYLAKTWGRVELPDACRDWARDTAKLRADLHAVPIPAPRAP